MFWPLSETSIYRLWWCMKGRKWDCLKGEENMPTALHHFTHYSQLLICVKMVIMNTHCVPYTCSNFSCLCCINDCIRVALKSWKLPSFYQEQMSETELTECDEVMLRVVLPIQHKSCGMLSSQNWPVSTKGQHICFTLLLDASYDVVRALSAAHKGLIVCPLE